MFGHGALSLGHGGGSREYPGHGGGSLEKVKVHGGGPSDSIPQPGIDPTPEADPPIPEALALPAIRPYGSTLLTGEFLTYE